MRVKQLFIIGGCVIYIESSLIGQFDIKSDNT